MRVEVRTCVARIWASYSDSLEAAHDAFAQRLERVPFFRADGPRHLGVIRNDCKCVYIHKNDQYPLAHVLAFFFFQRSVLGVVTGSKRMDASKGGKGTNRSVSNHVRRSHHARAVQGGSAAGAQRCRRMRQRPHLARSRHPKAHILRGHCHLRVSSVAW